MVDEAGRLLYVGKAGNLRARLRAYRRTPGQSRKTIRLIHCAARIEWELCESETAARLLEGEMIRLLRPRFNRAGTWPRSARFIAVRELPRGEGFALELLSEPEGECYGAFRCSPNLALGAMARLLWMGGTRGAAITALPHPLVATEGLRRFVANQSGVLEWLPAIRGYLAGQSDELVARFLDRIPDAGTGFDGLFLSRQFDCLLDFFRRGPVVNRRLREMFPHAGAHLAAEELDDLKILARGSLRTAVARPDWK